MRLGGRWRLAVTLLVFGVCPPATVHAGLIPRSGDVLLASETSDVYSGRDLICPAVAVGADGSAVVLSSNVDSYYIGGVQLRRIEADGTVGPEIQVSDGLDAHFPIGVDAIPGGFVAHWTRYGFPGSPLWHPGTVVRFLDASGNPVGASRFVDPGDRPQVAIVGEHLALVTRQPSTYNFVLRLIDRQGADVYPPRVISAPLDEETYQPHAVASDGEGGVVVAWVTGGWPYQTLKAQAFDPGGEPRSEPLVLARRAPVYSVHVAAAEGKFIVGWSEGDANRLLLRTFSLTGEPLGRPELPPARGSWWNRTRYLDDLLTTPQGLMIVWNTSRLEAYWDDLFAAELDWDWRKTTRGTRLHVDRLHEQHCGRLATNGEGDWVAAWQEVWRDDPLGPELIRNEARTFSGP